MVLEGMQYSERLIEECKKVFKEEHDLDLSSETANEYLNSMVKVFFPSSSTLNAQKESIVKAKDASE